jgi:hypothetical protein
MDFLAQSQRHPHWHSIRIHVNLRIIHAWSHGYGIHSP